MTAQILTSELSNLISESKRKNTDLRNAAEKSLHELKALHATSDDQLAGDLRRRPHFIAPFLLAGATRNAKLIGTAVNCLQRMVVSKCLAPQTLRDVLDAFSEATSQGFDVQLRILQALSSLFHNYGDDLSGPLLASALSICSTLQGSKTAAVNNTASATLQQLVVSVFDKVLAEDEDPSESHNTEDVPAEGGDIPVRTSAADAYKLFHDICLLTEGQRPQYIHFAAVRQTFGLELIESVLTNHASLFLAHPELAHVLRSRVMPFAITALSGRPNFATTVRVMRVLYILLRQHLSVLTEQCEAALDVLIRSLDQDIAPLWKRAMCMEVFRGIYTEPGLIRRIHQLYDEEEGRKNIVRDHVATLVRLASEKPAVIGLGQRSTVPAGAQSPANPEKQTALEAGGVVGMMGGAVSTQDGNAPGISVQSSSVRVPCIDHLDKADPPVLPESYIYSLVLNCINALSEGLAKFIMPLTIPPESRSKRKNRAPTVSESNGASNSPPASSKRKESNGRRASRKAQVPLNPLESTQHAQYADIKTCAAIVGECWPALLATCSTFLHAALDDDYHHDLVRSIQKITQVSGLFRLSTPRDAFLTTLSKAAVPSNVLSTHTMTTPSSPTSESPSMFANAKGLLSVESVVNQSPSSPTEKRIATSEVGVPSLNTRNLLCLRALLNLGIALGPTLQDAWSIVLEAVQQADLILYSSTRRTARQSPEGQGGADSAGWHPSLASEVRAVETATSRLLESTSDFPNEAFVAILRAMCKLLGVVGDDRGAKDGRTAQGPPNPPPRSPPPRLHQRGSSVSGISTSSTSRMREDQFALAKLGELAKTNLSRLTSYEPNDSGWSILVVDLVGIACSAEINVVVRLKAAEVLNKVVVDAVVATASEEEDARGVIQHRFLNALQTQVDRLGGQKSVATGSESEVHRLALEALKVILEQCGEALVAGWDIVFIIIGSAFAGSASSPTKGRSAQGQETTSPSASPKLVRSSFGSLQLICSDFLASLPPSCVLILVETLFKFCFQDDLNISLTTITFFWNVSDFLQRKIGSNCLTERACAERNEQGLAALAQSDDVEDACASLWLLLLLRLTAVTTDQRLEVRNGAVHTLLRIFDAYGDRLGPQAWRSCLQTVILRMMEENKTVLMDLDKRAEGREQDLDGWNDTTVLVLSGIAKLYADYLDMFIRQKDFADSWQTLMRYLEFLLHRKRTNVNMAIYDSLRLILLRMDDGPKVGPTALDQVWSLWAGGMPVERKQGSSQKGRYQDALTSYVLLFKEIYRLVPSALTEARLTNALSLIYDCAWFPDKPAYSNDVANMTPLQAQILDTFSLIQTEVPGVLYAVISKLSAVVTLPYKRDAGQDHSQRPLSYVALSQASMTLVEKLTLANISDPALYNSGALRSALEALTLPITVKYVYASPALGSQLFRPATTISLTILTAALDALADLGIDDSSLVPIWKNIIAITNAVISAPLSPSLSSSTIMSDQSFDTASFRSLRGLIMPSLGASFLPDKLRRTYTESLFHNSLIHPPSPGDLPSLDTEILAHLYTPRLGRTHDPRATKRSQMAYACLEELFSLVARHDGSAERVRLAQAASPFLILRVGLTLKAYIADQPLRGLSPQPLTQRRELIYVLDGILQLECEPRAIPEAPGVSSERKRHLHRLFPLVSRAVRVAGRDQEVLERLGRVGEVVAGEMGVL